MLDDHAAAAARAKLFRQRHDEGARSIAAGAVQGGTQKQYSLPWRRWKTFLELYTGTPLGIEEALLSEHSNRAKANILAAFVHYLYTDMKLTAGNICAHLSAVRHNFRTEFQDVTCFENPSLRACKTALKLRDLASATLNDPAPESKKRLPFAADMLLRLVETLDYSKQEDAMLITALYMGFCMLLRGSEYLFVATAEKENRSHAFLAQDVEFQLRDGRFVNAAQVQGIKWADVLLVRLTLQHAKNDKYRIGKVMWFRAGQHRLGKYDLVELLFTWAKRARLQPRCIFLSFLNPLTGAFFPLKDNKVREAVKRGAALFGFQPEFYGCHSLRIGGACALRAGGASDSMIQLMGRWQVLPSALGYQESSTYEFDKMLTILSDWKCFTHGDICLSNPKASVPASLRAS